MSDEEHAMLELLSERMGLSASDVVRQLIRHAHADALSKAARKRKRKR